MLHKGIIKITDFGFARYIENINIKLDMSQLGSPGYYAP
jgi:serine/threonine protein kinase